MYTVTLSWIPSTGGSRIIRKYKLGTDIDTKIKELVALGAHSFKLNDKPY